MKIPIRFKLLSQTLPTMPLSDEQIEYNFFHELMHFIFYYAGAAYSGKEGYMHRDKGFIDIVSGLLHQALNTMEYQ